MYFYLHLLIENLFCLRKNEQSDYVHNPVNVYHLLKRNFKWISKLQKWLPSSILDNFDISTIQDQFKRACHGLADIQEFNNLSTIDIANGKITNLFRNETFFAKSELNSFDLIQIAKEAQNSQYFDGAVNWMRTALEKAKSENCSEEYCSSLRYY